MKEKRITMKDVAAKAGVHQTSVSLALRNHPSLPIETRKRIQKLATELGYRPDPMLSSLAAYRRNTRASVCKPTIAYIMDLEGPEALKKSPPRILFLRNARQRAEELGYKLEVFYYAKGYYESKSLDRTLRTRNIEGVILAAFWDSRTDLDLSWERYSVIKIEMLPFNLRFDVVENNQMQATRLAMEKIHEMGYKRVGMAVAEHDEAHTRNLFSAGYMVGQAQFDPEDRVSLLVFEGKDLEKDAKTITEWLLKEKVDVVLSNWNELSPVISAANEKEKKDIRIIHLDLDHDNLSSTGIRQNHEDVGRYAVEQVAGLMLIHKLGMVECPTLHLIDSIWQSGTAAAVSRKRKSSGVSKTKARRTRKVTKV